jgi:hypothetical protein
MARKRIKRTSWLSTISVQPDEMIGVLEGKITYDEVIDDDTGISLGIPDMDLIRSSLRPSNDPASKRDGEYYIADFRVLDEKEEELELTRKELGLVKPGE